LDGKMGGGAEIMNDLKEARQGLKSE